MAYALRDSTGHELAIAPAGFGSSTDASNNPIVIDGLWALRAGNGGNGVDPDTVFFTAGPGGEPGDHFGSLAGSGGTSAGPEPATFVLLGSGLVAAIRRRRRA